MADGNIWRVEAFTSLQGINGTAVLHFRQNGDSTPDTNAAQFLANALNTQMLPLWAAWATNQMAFDGFRIRTISPNDPIAKSFSIPAKVGDIAGDPLPTNKTALAAWYTARTDNSGRGNTYFMGVP